MNTVRYRHINIVRKASSNWKIISCWVYRSEEQSLSSIHKVRGTVPTMPEKQNSFVPNSKQMKG